MRGLSENLPVDLGQDLRVFAQAGRNVLALEQEIDGPPQEPAECVSIDELGETGHVGCRQDKHVSKLSEKSAEL